MRRNSAEQRLQLLIDSIRDYAIFTLDPDGRIQSWNQAASIIKGYEAEEIIGEPIDTFYAPEDRSAGRPSMLLARARSEGRVEDEGWRVRKDGTRFWADVVLTALREPSGELVGFAKVTRDLTERRRSEEQRIQAEQRFRVLVDSVRDYAIFMLDPNGLVLTWNHGAQRLKGYEAHEIIGQHFSRFYRAEDIASGKLGTELEQALRYGRYEDEDWRIRKDGTKFWANVVVTPMYDQSGAHLGFAKITRDLTERRKAEEDRLLLVQAEQAVRIRDEFLSIASHELRTPLMSMQLQIDSASRLVDGVDTKLAQKLDRIARSSKRLNDLIETLLDVSRIATGHISLNPEPTDLSELVQEMVDANQDAATRAECELVTRIETGILGTWDPTRIGQVVNNLLANAFRYAAKQAVEITVSAETDDAVILIQDHGPGIPASELERIFGRFERAASTRHYGGLGLGLFVAREIVAGHQGTIVARNRDGGGACFEVRLPRDGSS